MKYVGDILYDKDLLDKSKTFVIYGAGTYGHKIFQYMDLNGMRENVLCFCDSDANKDEEYIEGIPVKQVEDVIIQYPKAEYLLGGKYAKEMYQVLEKNFIRQVHILLI